MENEIKKAQPSEEVPPKSLALVMDVIRSGGIAFVATYYRVTKIDGKTLARWEKAGQGHKLLREDGNGYRMGAGRSSVYLFPGQLKMVRPNV